MSLGVEGRRWGMNKAMGCSIGLVEYTVLLTWEEYIGKACCQGISMARSFGAEERRTNHV